MEELERKNIGIAVMKPFVANNALLHNVATMEECLRYIWSQPVSVVTPGCTTAFQMSRNAEIAKNFRPLNPRDMQNLLTKTEKFKGPQLEGYKRKLG